MNNIYIFHKVIDKKIRVKENDILTFDDGHYSILENIHLFKNLLNRKIIFITPNFIHNDPKRYYKPITDRYYMDDFFIFGRRRQFLTIYEIEDLIYKYDFEIGMHSFYLCNVQENPGIHARDELQHSQW